MQLGTLLSRRVRHSLTLNCTSVICRCLDFLVLRRNMRHEYLNVNVRLRHGRVQNAALLVAVCDELATATCSTWITRPPPGPCTKSEARADHSASTTNEADMTAASRSTVGTAAQRRSSTTELQIHSPFPHGKLQVK